MASSGAIVSTPPTVTGAFRQLPVPSSIFNPKDLRDLYKLLLRKATEAAELQIATLVLQPNQTQQQLDDLRAQVRETLALVVRVQSASGQWIGSTKMDPLTDEQFPNHVTRIEFNSFFLYQSRFHLYPNNYFMVVLDFSRPSVLDFNNVPAANSSSVTISGLNATWANALYEELATFFRQHPTRRGWLHFSQSYTALVIVVGFPLSFRVLSYLAPVIRRRITLPDALSVAAGWPRFAPRFWALTWGSS